MPRIKKTLWLRGVGRQHQKPYSWGSKCRISVSPKKIGRIFVDVIGDRGDGLTSTTTIRPICGGTRKRWLVQGWKSWILIFTCSAPTCLKESLSVPSVAQLPDDKKKEEQKPECGYGSQLPTTQNNQSPSYCIVSYGWRLTESRLKGQIIDKLKKYTAGTKYIGNYRSSNCQSFIRIFIYHHTEK